jgi:hypothetical protein
MKGSWGQQGRRFTNLIEIFFRLIFYKVCETASLTSLCPCESGNERGAGLTTEALRDRAATVTTTGMIAGRITCAYEISFWEIAAAIAWAVITTTVSQPWEIA